MKVSALALAALAACGRLGFDVTDDAPPGVAPGSGMVITLTGGTTWKVPSDWNNASNAIHCIGGGGAGHDGGGGGGGGGAYASTTGVALTPGSTVGYAIGAGGEGNGGTGGGS